MKKSRRFSMKTKRKSIGLGESLMTQTVDVPFRDVTTINRTATSGLEISTISLTIANFAAGSRPRVIGALYDYWRFKKLNIRVMYDTGSGPLNNSGTSTFGMIHAVGFVPSDVNNISSPSNLSDLMNLPDAEMAIVYKELLLRLNQSSMQGSNPVKWFQTANTGTPPTTEVSPGTLYHMTRTSATQISALTNTYIELSGILQFKAPLPTGSTFLSTAMDRAKLPADGWKSFMGEDGKSLIQNETVQQPAEQKQPATGDPMIIPGVATKSATWGLF